MIGAFFNTEALESIGARPLRNMSREPALPASDDAFLLPPILPSSIFFSSDLMVGYKRWQ